MQEINLTLPHLGFRIETREITVDSDRAQDILTAEEQQKTSYAVRNDNDVTITKHVIVCSYCGEETPAYADCISHSKKSFKSKTRDEIDLWATRQMSLFGEPPQTISFNDPIGRMDRFTCPHCSTKLVADERKYHVIIRSGRRKIKILRELNNFEDYFAVSWIKDFQTTDFDLYEAITFNLRNGHTSVSLENSTGEKLAVRDISNDDVSNMSEGPVFKLVQFYEPVYREIKRFFSKHWSGAFPFMFREMDAEKYILLTKFIGYDREFYIALPFSNAGNGIDKSFAEIAKRLHNANDVPALFKASNLPNIKTIRKIIFTNPALLFYLKELEIFCQIFNDPNFFRTFLGSREVYKALSTLHKYPRMADYYTELAAAIGQKALCNYLSNGNDFVYSYALEYLLLSDYEKRIARKKWTSSFFFKEDYREIRKLGNTFSVPIPPRNNGIDELECRIDGYSFVRLRNSKEYITAGKELQNCLGVWERFDTDVYVISKAGKYVAAVEISDDVITQAYTYQNGEIREDHELFSAFCTWKEQNVLIY